MLFQNQHFQTLTKNFYSSNPNSPLEKTPIGGKIQNKNIPFRLVIFTKKWFAKVYEMADFCSINPINNKIFVW